MSRFGTAQEMAKAAGIAVVQARVVSGSRPILTTVADVPKEKIKWLWPMRFALGKFSLIAGDPGTGKSTLTLDMAARVTTGTKWPDGSETAPQGDVIVLTSSEDDVASTIRPRLEAAGADLTRVRVLELIETVAEDGERSEREFVLRDVDALEDALRQFPNTKLIVADPITAFGDGTNSDKNSDVRTLLRPVTSLIARYGVAFVGITHLNKAYNMPALYRAISSIGFVAVARAVWGVVKESDDPDRRLFVCLKNNIGPDTDGLAYRLDLWDEDPEYTRIAWEADPVSVTANEAMDSRDGERHEWEECRDLLKDLLADGPVTAEEVYAEMDRHGFSKKTARKAKGKLKAKAKKSGYGKDAPWMWSL